MIDWTPVTTAIVGLIVVLITTFIPLAIKLFFEAWQAKLEKAKAVIDSHQDIVDAIVLVVQQTANGLGNSEKLNLALKEVDAALHLPDDSMRKLIAQSVATFKLAWGSSWTELGAPPTNTSPTTLPPAI
jgi:hypothetical protein